MSASIPEGAASTLFRPFTGGGLSLKNRVALAPMTRRMSPGGIPTRQVADYYARRAAADVGLIITEGVWIDHPAASNSENVPVIYGEAALAGWQPVIDGVHAAGSTIVAQLWHVGAKVEDTTSDSVPEHVVSPSGFYDVGHPIGRAMTDSDIADVIDAYARGCVNARRAGFDGVEFHGAHGYLIDQFLWERTNQRGDRYGGANLRDRTRFATELLRACRQAVGPDYPLIMRVSQFKAGAYDYKHATSPDALADLIEPLVDAGVSLLHASQRRFWEAEFAGSEMNLAGWIRKLSGLPVITVGSVGLSVDTIETNYVARGTQAQPQSLERLEGMLDRGEVDLVAVGRALLQDPLWAQKVRLGQNDRLQPYSVDALNQFY